MIYSEVIIVGGGPAGSTCAWKLKQSGVDCIILDRKIFPRPKVCAGWITPKVLRDLQIDPSNYPHSIVSFNKLIFHVYGKRIPLKTRQYSIRRVEFDNWLLERSGVTVYNEQVLNIEKDDDFYILDDKYQCKYLVGAAGTYCPVYRTFFENLNPRVQKHLIIGMECEFVYDYKDSNCYLWFFEKNLPGYAWYVPKGDGYLNVGLGGSFAKLKDRNINIRNYWNYFVDKLEKLSLVHHRKLNPKGYNYYLRQNVKVGQFDNAFIIGDAAGLATKDMGEGIGPAVESGILAANSIIKGTKYSLKSLAKYSIFDMILSGFIPQPRRARTKEVNR